VLAALDRKGSESATHSEWRERSVTSDRSHSARLLEGVRAVVR